MKYVRLIKEWIDGMLLCVPSVNKRYVARKMRNKDKLPLSHGWFPISMDDIERAIIEYANNLFDHDQLVIDIVYCHQRYLTSPNEYFHFAFDGVNRMHSHRKEFLAEDMMNLIMINVVGSRCCDELEDKYGLYLKLKPYYKREVCKVESESDYNKYLDFIGRHDGYFVKPNSSSCGRGCYKVESPHTHTHTQCGQ